MNIKELFEKRCKIVHDMRELRDRADAEKRDLSGEENSKWDELFDAQAAVQAQIDREEKLRSLENSIEKATSDAIVPESRAAKPKEDRAVEHAARPVDAPEYVRAFAQWLRFGGRGLGADEHRALSVGTDSEGGYTVPAEQFVRKLIQALDDQVFMRGAATKFQLAQAKKITFPTLAADLGDPTWTTEIGTGSADSTLAFGQLDLDPQPLARRLLVSQTLLRESVLPVEQIVRERFAYKFGYVMESNFLTGTGVSGKPCGVFDTSGLATGRDSSEDNTTTAVTVDGLISVVYKLDEKYHKNAQWMAHPDFYKKVSKLKTTYGEYLWERSKQVGQPDVLLGFPCRASKLCPNTWTAGLYLAVLGDFSYYYIVDALNMTIQRLDELYAESNQVGFIGRLESTGKPALEEAFARCKLATG